MDAIKKIVGKALNTPNNNYLGMSELFPVEGLIKAVDKELYTVDVQTSDAVFRGVMLPIYGYTRGSGLFTMPSVGDWCLVMRNMRGEAFLINTYPFNGKEDLNKQFRENPVEQAYILKSPKDITLKVETPAESGIIKVTTDDAGKVTMSLTINAMKKNSDDLLEIDTSQELPKVEMTDETITITAKDGTNKIVIDADGISLDTRGSFSPVVTQEDLNTVFTTASMAALSATGDSGSTIKGLISGLATNGQKTKA